MVQFVALSDTSVATSPDGTTWTARTVPSATWVSIDWNGTVYCITADNSASAATSPDGITWTARTLPSSNRWYSLAWNGSVFCAVSFASDAAATSPDGVTWTARTLPSVADWRDMAWNGSVFCAVAYNSASAATSPDGITWTGRTISASGQWVSISWNGTVFCAVALNSASAATSPDGITWTTRTLPSAASWQSISWNGTVFCVVALNTTAAATSPDGITWTTRTLPSASSWRSIAWNGSAFCAVTLNSTIAATSPDGITWTARTLPSSAGWGDIVGVNLEPDTFGASGISLAALNVSNTAITDTLGLSDQVLAAIITLSEGYSGNSSDVQLSGIIATGTADSEGLKSSIVTLANIIASGTAASGAVNHFVDAASTGEFVSTVSAPTIFWEVVLSSTTIAGTIAVSRTIDATVTGTVSFNGSIVGQASYSVSAESIVEIISGIKFVQDFWDGWAFNLNTAASSMYEDFKFNSFARLGNKFYGCNDTGIHLLGGGLDGAVQIDAVITTGTSELTTDTFDGNTLKSVPYAYVSARSPTEMILTCRVEGAEYDYIFRAPQNVVEQSRVDIGRGLKGTFWQFELRNRSGADMEIDSLAVIPQATRRRI